MRNRPDRYGRYPLAKAIVKRVGAGLIAASLLVSSSVRAEDPEGYVYFVTDPEGYYDQIDALTETGVVESVNGKMKVRAGDTLVSGGDLCDRFPDCEKLLDFFNGVEGDVHVVMGNRDMNKLSYPFFRENLSRDREYVTFLRKKASSIPGFRGPLHTIDNEASRVEYWAEKMWLSPAIENHRLGMEAKLNRKVGLDEAARNFAELITDPDGKYFQYMKKGKLAYWTQAADGTRIAVTHGGLPSVPGFVPEEAVPAKNFVEWERRLNKYYTRSIERFRTMLRSKTIDPDPLLKQFVAFGDAAFSAMLGMVWNNSNSTIYVDRFRDEGEHVFLTGRNYGDFFSDGKWILLNGHQPAGNFPQLNRVSVPKTAANPTGEFFHVYGDTSFSPLKKKTVIRVSKKDGSLEITGRLADGRKVTVKTRLGDRSLIGKIVNGQVNIGIAEDGRSIGFHYEGHTIVEKNLAAEELSEAVDAVADRSSTMLKQKMDLINGLRMRGIRVYETLPGSWEEILNGRTPAWIGGSSDFANATDEPTARKMMTDMLDKLDPKNVVFFTGSTDSGYERIFHELAAARGFDVYGFSVSAATPEEVSKTLKGVFWVGDEWSEQVRAEIRFILDYSGFGVIFGGGGAMTTGLSDFDPSKLNLFYAKTIRHGNGNVSASMTYAEKQPGRAFASSEELIDRIKKFASPAVKKNVLYLTPEEAIARTNTLKRRLNRKLVSVLGFSDLGYANEGELRAWLEYLATSVFDPKVHLISTGGTRVGIGDPVYEVFSKHGYITLGQVGNQVDPKDLSAIPREVQAIKGVGWGGRIPGTNELDGVSKVITRTSDIVVAAGGGPIGGDEFAESRRLRLPVIAKELEANPVKLREREAKLSKKAGKQIKLDPRGDLIAGLDAEGVLKNGMFIGNHSREATRFYCGKALKPPRAK